MEPKQLTHMGEEWLLDKRREESERFGPTGSSCERWSRTTGIGTTAGSSWTPSGQKGRALMFASEQLQADREIVLVAAAQKLPRP